MGAYGLLCLGVIRGAARAKVVPAKYRHEIMLEVRNAAGQGVRTPWQLLVGVHLARKRGPALRLSLRQRQAFLGKRRGKSAAPSQKKLVSDTHVSPLQGYAFEDGEQYNYFCASRFEGLFSDVVGF